MEVVVSVSFEQCVNHSPLTIRPIVCELLLHTGSLSFYLMFLPVYIASTN